jgi:phage shock protein PspC (stress-responsive transcriptional regulator)
MKKTFTINISGRFFHIEDDAFEKLQEYLKLLKQCFENQPGGQEILQDIESRIAELLQEKMTEGQEAVTIDWVDELIHRMGNPEYFMEQDHAGDEVKASPEAKGGKPTKRLYRDIENRVLGGVCSGMSAYFNIDPVILRILFVVLVIIGAGVFVIVYLILWIVVPKASTTAQRLEMRGEDATILNIKKSVQEELTEVKNSFSKINRSEPFQKGKEAVSKAGRASARVLKGTGKAIASVFGSVLILIGFAGIVTFFISMLVGGSLIHASTTGITPGLYSTELLGFLVSPGLVSAFLLLSVLLIGIPLLAILFIGTKLVFRYKTNNKLIGLGAFGIWLAALVAMLALTAGQVSNFSQKNTISSGKPLGCITCKTLYLEMEDASGNLDPEKNARFDDFTLISQEGKNVLAGNPTLRIEETEAADFSVVIRKQARGANAAEVQKHLENISYELTSKDSILFLSSYFTLGNQSKWRNQEVELIVKVPKGKAVHLGANLDQMRFNFDNVNNMWAQQMTGKTWMMTPEGLTLKE